MKSDNKLVIIEKYEEFVNYIYPVLQNIPRKHGIVKEQTIKLIFEAVEMFYKALKSNMKSRLYEADAHLANIRWHLRFLANSNRRLISQKQHQVANLKLKEVGSILNSWIKNAKR